MIYEVGLISVLVGAGYWGWFFVRERPHGTATFGAMQLVAAALAGLGFLGRRLDIAWLGIPGAIGLGGGFCLLLLGPVARLLARRLVASERMALATRLLDLAEHLAPGSGVAEEKAVVRAMSEIREGRIEQTVDALLVARERASADARLAIDERITMLYLAANRWRDAIGHAEAHLLAAPPPAEVPGSLRAALGVAPPVWVDLLGAYGRTGEFDDAARMLLRLEDACAGREDAALWIHRGRMMFLALTGRPEAVRTLVAPRRSRHMSIAARNYWLAVAHERAGERAAAAAHYGRARSRSRGRQRELIAQAIAGLGDARAVELAAVAREVVARTEAAPLPPPVRIAHPPRLYATWSLTAAVLAVAAVTGLLVGDTGDAGVMVRAGAMAPDLVAAGEWWRMVTSVFAHAGLLHLALNAIGLVVLGRLTEELFGAPRTFAVFGIAGVTGALASYFASQGSVSTGASGAVFGLLGALFVEITWHRQRYRLAWKRGMWGALVVIAVGELGYGAVTPVIDQWAHGGGLLAGAVLGVLLSPSARWARAGTLAARAIAIGFGAIAALGAMLVAQTSVADSLTRGGTVRQVVDHIAVEAPARWRVVGNQLVQADGLVELQLQQVPTAPASSAGQIGRGLDTLIRELQAAAAGNGSGSATDSGGGGGASSAGSGGSGSSAGSGSATGSGSSGGSTGSSTGSDSGSGSASAAGNAVAAAPAPEGDAAHDGGDDDSDGTRLTLESEPLIPEPAGWDCRELAAAPVDAMGYRQRLRIAVCGRAFGDRTAFLLIRVPETIAVAAPEVFAQLLASIGPA